MRLQGRLFIKFDVEFPDSKDLKSHKKRQLLREALPHPQDTPMLPAEIEKVDVVAKSVDLRKEKEERHSKARKQSEDDNHRSGCSGVVM
jgi:hypothetical protein